MKSMFKAFNAIPLFGILLVLYFLASTILGKFYPGLDAMDSKIHGFKLPSTAIWYIRVSDVIILIGLFVLYIELFKSTKATDTTIYEHILSLFVFLAYLLIFLYAPMVANSTFVILGAMSFIDVVAGITITITAARKDLSLG